jgi:hypothetical protein
MKATSPASSSHYGNVSFPTTKPDLNLQQHFQLLDQYSQKQTSLELQELEVVFKICFNEFFSTPLASLNETSKLRYHLELR